MKRMKKKVVAMVTLAMFVMTLLPMAAFAAPATEGKVANSSVATVLDTTDADLNEEVALVFNTTDDENNEGCKFTGAKVWATKEGATTPVKNTVASFFKADGQTALSTDVYSTGVYYNVELSDKQEFVAKFTEPGKYTIHVAKQEKTPTAGTEWKEVPETVTINVAERVADKMTIKKAGGANMAEDANGFYTFIMKNERPDFQYNNIEKVGFEGKIVDENNKAVANQTVTITTTKDDVVKLNTNEVTTDRYGNFSFNFGMLAKVDASIVVTSGELSRTIKVIADETAVPEAINTTKEDGYVLAGNDTNWDAKKYALFTDAVQFAITDQKGDAVTGSLVGTKPADKDGEPAFGLGNVDGYQHEDFVAINKGDKPVKSTLAPEDIVVAWDSENEVYTLKYVGNNPAKDLVAGEYTVTVGLKSGKTATATFNVAKFTEKGKKFEASYYQADNENGANIVAIDNTITKDKFLVMRGNYVDVNGIKVAVPAKDVQFGAVSDVNLDYVKTTTKGNVFEITGKDEALGTLVKTVAFDSATNTTIPKDITIVDNLYANTLAFDSNEGLVNKDNKVNVTVVDKDGKYVKEATGKMDYYIVKNSNKDAKVSVEVVGNDLKLYSNAPTTIEVVVADKEGTAIYYNTLTYTFGQKDEFADTSVVLSIGSTDMVVNNEVVKIDAAPYVDKNWRTMVPLSAISNAFGKDAEWDNDKRTVTVEMNGVKVVMTIDKKTYTVNGEEKTMDTAPVIVNSRTMVPVRFVAEELGFTVTPLYNSANGTTESVVIQK